MTYNTWVKRILLIIFMIPVLIAALNYFVDPFGIFRRNPNTCVQANERYVKIAFLKREHQQFNGYLIGSSRIGTTNPEIIEKYRQGQKFYNMTISAGTLTEFQKIINYMIVNHYSPKTFYLQIDIYDNLLSDHRDPSVLFLRAHPEIEQEHLYQFLKRYLLSFSYEDLSRQIKSDLGIEISPRNSDFFRTGCWYADKEEKNLLKDPKEYVRNEPSFHKKLELIHTNETAVNNNLNALRQIVASCRKNNIELIVFITPHNHVMQDIINFEDYQNFLTQIVEITDYWDFSGYDSITNDDTNYYEYSHYRPKVASLIAERVFNDTNLSIPTDFGVYVTKETIQKHLRDLKIQRIDYRDGKKYVIE